MGILNLTVLVSRVLCVLLLRLKQINKQKSPEIDISSGAESGRDTAACVCVCATGANQMQAPMTCRCPASAPRAASLWTPHTPWRHTRALTHSAVSPVPSRGVFSEVSPDPEHEPGPAADPPPDPSSSSSSSSSRGTVDLTAAFYTDPHSDWDSDMGDMGDPPKSKNCTEHCLLQQASALPKLRLIFRIVHNSSINNRTNTTTITNTKSNLFC